MPVLIVVRGYPSVGKTTVGRMLAHKGAGRFIDHNQIINTICSMVGDDEGIYEEIHRFELALTEKVLEDGYSAIVGRGFTKKLSLEPYRDLAKQMKAKFVVIRLIGKLDTLKQRVRGSDRFQNQLSINSPQELMQWIERFPMEDYPGEHIIGVEKAPEHVVLEIQEVVSSQK